MVNEYLNKSFSLYQLVVYDIPRSNYIKNNIINFNYTNKINNDIRVDLFIRKLWWEDTETTRLHDIGPRLENAIVNGGWACTLQEPGKFSMIQNSNKKTIAIIDIQTLFFKSPNSHNIDYLSQIRDMYDRVIFIFYDAWNANFDYIQNTYNEYADYFWIPCAETRIINQYKKIKPVLSFPCAWGINARETQMLRDLLPSNSDVSFVGGIDSINSPRIFWKAALNSLNVHFDISSHKRTNLYAIDDFVEYLKRLTISYSNINFTHRHDGSNTLTGRSMEVLCIGKSLIQQYSETMHFYFEPNEHYLEFKNINELSLILDTIYTAPKAILEMGLRAANHYDSYYSDQMLTKHIQTILD